MMLTQVGFDYSMPPSSPTVRDQMHESDFNKINRLIDLHLDRRVRFQPNRLPNQSLNQDLQLDRRVKFNQISCLIDLQTKIYLQPERRVRFQGINPKQLYDSCYRIQFLYGMKQTLETKPRILIWKHAANHASSSFYRHIYYVPTFMPSPSPVDLYQNQSLHIN
ncbi:hypothetical protein OSB04_003993 [Centaurea solstitialis]|uniref:Uncharacterized protein n=1 Tax=Centaurea solstitialis TaxID=347529 RepID=A0AA38WPD9_9ASTR|nr:hypothetical protein OSB04_003993 [Centaurea solstitialis]